MKLKYWLLLFSLLVSCNSLKNNYSLMNKIIESPDSIRIVLNDTNVTSFIYKMYPLDEGAINAMQILLKEKFTTDRKIVLDETMNFKYSDLPKIFYKEHLVLIEGNDNSFIFFSFIKEDKWRLKEIGEGDLRKKGFAPPP